MWVCVGTVRLFGICSVCVLGIVRLFVLCSLCVCVCVGSSSYLLYMFSGVCMCWE